MFKRVLMVAAIAAAVSAPAFAEVSINGSAEMDLFVRTNQAAAQGTTLAEEIAIVVNVDGKDKLDNGDTLKWRLAQKVATDWRYDGWGGREAWIGYAGNWGELRFGTQFTNAYLTLDWPYGSKAQGNLSADFGAVNDKWKDAITYFSPDFGGFNFTAQYKIGADTGSKGTGKAANTLTNGYDIGVNGAFGPVAVNAGWQRHNDALFGQAPIGAGGSGDVIQATDAVNGASTDMYFVGARGSFGDFSVKALYKNNTWKAEGNKLEVNQYLVGGTYSAGKNAFSLGWQEVLDGKYNGKDLDNSVQQISGQWDYSLSKNTGAFLQARYHMYGKDTQAFKVDGSAGYKTDDTLRVLVGTWTGF
ncbi:porin [Deefgea piscis]|uniref:Porin n=1 Tax=Deefgea piscis TaxID=2739061 RepID=A0A6M8SV24_9NEIS|nr:porin [Deefgea piscis]QKJ65717.1 porin [Deefgea piscis]